MSFCKRLHRAAMDLVDIAIDMRAAKEASNVWVFEVAFEAEKLAAEQLNESDIEPSRSVLYRSAAALANECCHHDEAKELAETGLEGNPPPEIKAELEEERCEAVKAMEGHQ